MRPTVASCTAHAPESRPAGPFDDPAGTLERLGRHFGHRPDAGELRRMVDAGVLGTHATEPSRPFGQEQRQTQMNEIRGRHDRELAQAMAWAEPAVAATGVLDSMRTRRLAA